MTLSTSQTRIPVRHVDIQADAGDYSVVARRFDLAGTPRGDAFIVSEQHQSGTQNGAAIAVASLYPRLQIQLPGGR